MNDYTQCRLWQVYFGVNRTFRRLNRPFVLAEEAETDPEYRMDGRFRPDDGGQISLTLSGRGMISIRGSVRELHPGDAFLHNHGDADVCYFLPKNAAEPWRFVWVAFTGGEIEKTIAEINARYGYCFHPGLESELRRELTSYRARNGELLQLTPLEAHAITGNFLRLLCESVENAVRSTPHGKLVGEVQNFIAANPDGDLRAESLAEQFGLSREHLSRVFRKQSGSTLQEYVSSFRLRLANDLLRQTRLSGKEICARCGFATYASFYRAFVRQYGVAPQHIRLRRTP